MALLLVVVLRTADDDEEEIAAADLTTTTATPAVDRATPAAAGGPAREALGVGEYERLLAQGEAAVGQRVVTQLYCEEVASIKMDGDAEVHASVAQLADVNGRVPGAECAWGEGAGAQDLLLLVPASLAPRFAAAPEVQQGFVRRRRVRAEVEWVGRSEALALRNVVVLRNIQ